MLLPACLLACFVMLSVCSYGMTKSSWFCFAGARQTCLLDSAASSAPEDHRLRFSFFEYLCTQLFQLSFFFSFECDLFSFSLVHRIVHDVFTGIRTPWCRNCVHAELFPLNPGGASSSGTRTRWPRYARCIAPIQFGDLPSARVFR